jgi:putative hydrolase of the HAD superfamily
MVYPEMIIFDYGHTLLYEPGFDTLRGERALTKYIKSNKNNYSAEEISYFSNKIFQETRDARDLGYELHQWPWY